MPIYGHLSAGEILALALSSGVGGYHSSVSPFFFLTLMVRPYRLLKYRNITGPNSLLSKVFMPRHLCREVGETITRNFPLSSILL